MANLLGLGDQPLYVLDDLLLGQPIAVPGSPPGGDILIGDEPAAELGPDHGPHAWQRIQPAHHSSAEFAILEAAIELFTDVARQPRDLTNAGGPRCRICGIDVCLAFMVYLRGKRAIVPLRVIS